MYIIVIIIFCASFVGCCHHPPNPSVDKDCAEIQGVVNGIQGQYKIIAEKPEITKDEMRRVVQKLNPSLDETLKRHYPWCEGYAEKIRVGVYVVIDKRGNEYSLMLQDLCSEDIDPEDRDVIAIAAIMEQRVGAKKALERLNLSTEVCK